MTTLDCALALWRRGLNLIDVPPPRPGVLQGSPGDGKVPIRPWREYQTIRQIETDITRMFAGEPSNIAIITGAVSGIVVIDGDSMPAVRYIVRTLPYTPWQTQTSAGFHFYYRHPGVPVRNRARIDTRDGKLAIDVRGDGGYVIAPGSIHATGIEYLEAGDWSEPKENLPVFWPGWLQRSQRSAPAAQSLPRPQQGDVVDRARRYLAAIPRPEIGHGSDAATLYAACRLVRGFGLTEGEAIALLWDWAGNRHGWTCGWIAEKVRHAMRYGSEPIGALR